MGIHLNAYGHGSSFDFRMVDAVRVAHFSIVTSVHARPSDAGAYYAAAIRVATTGSTARRAVVLVRALIISFMSADCAGLLVGGLVERPAMPKDVLILLMISSRNRIWLIDLLPQVLFQMIHGYIAFIPGAVMAAVCASTSLLHVIVAWRFPPPLRSAGITIESRFMCIIIVTSRMVTCTSPNASSVALVAPFTVDESALVLRPGGSCSQAVSRKSASLSRLPRLFSPSDPGECLGARPRWGTPALGPKAVGPPRRESPAVPTKEDWEGTFRVC